MKKMQHRHYSIMFLLCCMAVMITVPASAKKSKELKPEATKMIQEGSLEQLIAENNELGLPNGVEPIYFGVSHTVDEPEFEWSQFRNKVGMVEFGKKGLMLVSKSDKGIIYTTTELPINLTDEFEFGAIITGKVDKNKGLGLIFDYSDSRNFKGVMFTKDHYTYYTIKNGESSIVKQGLVKTGKSPVYAPKLLFKGGTITVFLGNQEVTVLKNVTLTESVFGVAIEGKTSASFTNFFFNVISDDTDTEASTTDY